MELMFYNSFIIPQGNPVHIGGRSLFSTVSSAWQPLICLVSVRIFLLWIFHMNRIIYTTMWSCVSGFLSLTCFQGSPVLEHVLVPDLFFWLNNPLYRYHNFLFIIWWRCLAYFYLLAVVNSAAATNIQAELPLSLPLSLPPFFPFSLLLFFSPPSPPPSRPFSLLSFLLPPSFSPFPLFIFRSVGMDSRASHMLCKCSTYWAIAPAPVFLF